MKHTAALVLLFASGALFAQSSMTLPVGLENIDGSGTTAFPFNSNTDHIWQWHYANSNFAGITGPITIIELSVRADSPATSVAAFSFPSVTISVGSATTGYQVTQHNAVFANNLCQDLTVVRSGPWSGGPVPPSGGTTGTWIPLILTTPFVFDPSSGRDLIVQIEKCGAGTPFGAGIDGPFNQGMPGTVGGNRYGVTNSCSAPSYVTTNNEFVPVLKVDFVAGGTPGICFSEYQVNQPAASMTVDGALDPGGAVPLVTERAVGQGVSLDIASNNPGLPWDIAVIPGATSVSGTGGGLLTGGGQVVNVDLTNPGLVWLNGVFSGPGFASASIPFTASSPLIISLQMAVFSPGSVDGFALSHVNDFAAVGCMGSGFEGLPLALGSAPIGWLNPSNGGIGWTVNTGSTTSVGTGPTAAAVGSNYLYTETSGAGSGATFSIDTCPLDATQLSQFTLNFQLSRIGSAIGTLNIYQDDGTGSFTTLLMTYAGANPLQSQGGLEWSSESLFFNPTGPLVAFRFEHVNGPPGGVGGFTGDMALDEIFVQ